MLLSPQLIAAYERADYEVHGAFTLKIGRRSAALDALLEAHGATSAAFVTAACLAFLVWWSGRPATLAVLRGGAMRPSSGSTLSLG